MENNTNNNLTRNKKQKIILTITAILLAVVCFFGGFFVNRLINGKKINRVNEIIRIMENVGFVLDENGNPREITEEEYADAIVNGILDKYSRYFTAEEYQEYISSGNGNAKGIGINFYDYDCIIDKVKGNSPADKAGVKAGDKIVSLSYNGTIKDITAYSEIHDYLDTIPNDTEFEMSVLRGAENLTFILKKIEFQASYVTYYDSEVKYCFESDNNETLTEKIYNGKGNAFLGEDVAYIAFIGFEGKADSQMFSALDYMKERGRTKLVLDLRGNGGGYMNILTEIAGALIYCNGKNNFTVALAESKNNTETFYSGKNRFNSSIESIAVIADKYSASASECLIGAMIHYGGAFNKDKLVIEKDSTGKANTCGKGIMQTSYGLVGGGALKLTTARVLWPDGTTCIHEKGISTIEQNQVEKDQALNRALQVL